MKIICQLLENIVLNIICNRLYPYIKEKKVKKIDKNIEYKIFKKVKALFFHKIGSVVVLGTDNILISKFINVKTVGLYTNYNMILNAVNTLSSQIITSSVASVGNMLVTGDSHNKFLIFRRIRFLNFWLACFTGTCLLVIMQSFIKIWVGKKFLLSNYILIILVFEYYQKITRKSYSVFKDASGTWEEDKYIPLIESLLNLVFSIILLKFIGLSGVFLGTIISSLVLWCYSYPKFVYKKLFDRSYLDYSKETLGYLFLFFLIAFSSYGVSLLFKYDSLFVQLLMNILVALIIPNILFFMIFRKADNFNYFLFLLKKIKNKIIHNN